MIGCLQISRRAFYQHGGFANPYLFRRMRGGAWRYYYNARK